MIDQIARLIRIFGPGRLLKMKARHEEALPAVRGYMVASCFCMLLNTGILDDLASEEEVELDAYAKDHGMDPHVLRSVCEYMDCLGVLRVDDGRCRLLDKGRRFMEEPRGMFDLLHAYRPLFEDLENLVTCRKRYGEDVFRRAEFVAKGSGQLGRQLPFPVLQRMISSHGFRRILDIGCGDMEFPLTLVRDGDADRCYGIDIEPDAVAYANDQIRRAGLENKVEAMVADMFDLEEISRRWADVDALAFVDVFHEYLFGGTEKIEDFLAGMRRLFPASSLVVAEFCRQSHQKLRRNPTAFAEHHLFHNLTMQLILSADEWTALFERSGYRLIEKQVFDMVGHGYFVLKGA